MGLLDDAIREHLELKRKHGAAPDEVAEKEAEAFGPARREPAAEPVEEPAAEELEVVDEPVAPAPAAPEPELYAGEPLEEEPLLEEPLLEEPLPEEPLEPEPLEPEPLEPEEPRVRSGDTPPYGAPAVEPDELGEEEEDVLEETPDFLQETPEHDRLWFEQRPPRDFDFDD